MFFNWEARVYVKDYNDAYAHYISQYPETLPVDANTLIVAHDHALRHAETMVLHREFWERHHHDGGDCMCFEDEYPMYETREDYIERNIEQRVTSARADEVVRGRYQLEQDAIAREEAAMAEREIAAYKESDGYDYNA
jgi:hypothetical protein